MKYNIISVNDKGDRALQAICSTQESAIDYLKNTVPRHIALSYYMDKTLGERNFFAEPRKKAGER